MSKTRIEKFKGVDFRLLPSYFLYHNIIKRFTIILNPLGAKYIILNYYFKKHEHKYSYILIHTLYAYAMNLLPIVAIREQC